MISFTIDLFKILCSNNSVDFGLYQKLSKGFLALAVIAYLAFVSMPAQAQASRGLPESVAFSPASHIYVLLPGYYKTDESLYALEHPKNDARGARVSDPARDVSCLFSYGSVPNVHPFRNAAGNLHGVFRKAWHQACLLLDVPPPSF